MKLALILTLFAGCVSAQTYQAPPCCAPAPRPAPVVVPAPMPTVPRQLPTPPGQLPTLGSRDSDGDGVVDSRDSHPNDAGHE